MNSKKQLKLQELNRNDNGNSNITNESRDSIAEGSNRSTSSASTIIDQNDQNEGGDGVRVGVGVGVGGDGNGNGSGQFMEYETRLRLIEANRSQQQLLNVSSSLNSLSFSQIQNQSQQNNENGTMMNTISFNDVNENINRDRRSNDQEGGEGGEGDYDDENDDRDKKEGLVEIEILLTNSSFQKKSLRLERSTKIIEVKSKIFEDWPSEWDFNLKPIEFNQLRMVYFGRFLDDEELLSSLRLNQNGPSIIHLVIKPIESDLNDNKSSSRWKCLFCSIDNCFGNS